MDLLKKYIKNDFLFPLVSDYITYYLKYINEKPVSSVLAPMTLILFCYYVYIYVRKFYPIYVNCWFCNANFKVPFEDRFEYTCIECGQFNGFKEDGSYSKTIPEQHDQRYNQTTFTTIQNDIYENKNGLCHKCNYIQEIKMKQLASFVPIKEKNYDREIEKFKEHLEATLTLCYKCNQYTKKVLLVQEQRYNLKSFRTNNQLGIQDGSNWPNICSICLSLIIFILSASVENHFNDWAAKFVYTPIFHNSLIVTRSIGIASLVGILCQVYQCLNTMDKLSAITLLLWASVFVINNFEILNHLQPKLIISTFMVLLSSISIHNNLTKKPKIRQTNIQLEDEKHKTPNYCEISKSCMASKSKLRKTHFLPGPSNEFIVRLPKFKVARVLNEKILLEAIPNSVQYTTKDDATNGLLKNKDESEMMDVDYIKEYPKKEKKALNTTVNNLFQGLKLNDNQKKNLKNNVIRPQKFFFPSKHEKMFGYAESSPGCYTSYPMKDDYEFDAQSVFSQQSYRSQCLPMCHQTTPSCTYYAAPPFHYQQSPLNLSHSSNTSSIQQQTSEWQKMLVYSIPGIILLTLQCYLLYDIKDFMKQK